MYKVYAVIVNYNGFNDTIECIESLKQSNYPLKIIVVDNNSNNYEGDNIQSRYPDVVVIKSDKNLGFAGGNNIGIKYALNKEADFILLINNDTIIDNHMVELLLEATNENTVASPCMYYYSNLQELWYGGGRVGRYTGIVRHFTEANSRKTTFVTGCCVMVHCNTFKKVGLLNEKYFMYCEDTEFSIRLNKSKISIKIVPEAKLWHKVGKSSGGDNSDFSIYYMNRNKLYYIKDNKGYFYFTALPFALVTRYIRILQYKLKKDEKYKVIKKAVNDYKNGVVGKVEFFK